MNFPDRRLYSYWKICAATEIRTSISPDRVLRRRRKKRRTGWTPEEEDLIELHSGSDQELEPERDDSTRTQQSSQSSTTSTGSSTLPRTVAHATPLSCPRRRSRVALASHASTDRRRVLPRRSQPNGHPEGVRMERSGGYTIMLTRRSVLSPHHGSASRWETSTSPSRWCVLSFFRGAQAWVRSVPGAGRSSVNIAMQTQYVHVATRISWL